MKLTIYRHLWGVDEGWETAFPKIKATGLYGGIECPLPSRADQAKWLKLLKDHGFSYLAMGFTGGATVSDHLKSLREQATHAKELGAVFINVHSGSDHWQLADGIAFFTEAIAIERAVGIEICHETHRGRVLFNPRDTRLVLEAVPQLKLAVDFSHWVCACESLLEGQTETFALVAKHAKHVHARVGYEEGPQVPDPRAPEYQRHVLQHEKWWDLCWDAAQAAGAQVTTLTPEFGPPGYLHTLPHTNVPVANLWDICNWQAQRQRERFDARGKKSAKA
jgi:sugar phosphate isomerase/epimerase